MNVPLARLNELSDSTPLLVNLKPVGNGYMEDFFAAGGMGALLRELAPLLDLDCMTVTGETLRQPELVFVTRSTLSRAATEARRQVIAQS